ncbi:zinc finger protein 436-like isoform X23 [Periplaneta americana]|uniref:zinc finger protein 436-like isoform X23 n=1 Tax=Periplaneta americana TaxID=6978 RepID=UPI0037E920CC
MLYVERENSGHLPNGEQEGDTSEIMETSIMEGEEYYNQEGGEWTQKVDTGQLCRVCANPNDYLIPIFDGEGLEHELSMKIQKHLPIKVTETDTLPQHMCYQCASTLIAWHDLVISCVEADKKLRELQMEENDDDDDKGGEMFESPSLDSEMTDDVIQPSTSETQNQNQVSKTPSSKKAAVAKEKKSKLKMILVKGPPAGTSGQKTASKTQVAKALELAKSKDGVSQDSASERYLQLPLEPFTSFLEAKNALKLNHSSLEIHSEDVDKISQSMRKSKFERKKNRKHIQKTAFHTNAGENIHASEECEKQSKVIGGKYKVCTVSCVVDRISKSISGSENLEKRMKLADIADRPIYKCKICERKLSTKSNLKIHMRIHSDERPYTCHVCGKQFRTPKGLNRHVKEVHDCIKEHNCDICGRSFASKATRDDHRRIHTGERPYVCDKCGKTFKTKASLYIHKKNHLDTFPFHCSYCHKKFRRKDGLLLHVTTHTGERSHVCDICGKCFRVKNELTRHARIHSGEKPFTCSECGLSFGQKRYLKNHEKTHHRISM